MREQWHCKECQRKTPENQRWDNSHDVFIHCVNGLIVEIASSRPPEEKLPDWNLIHRLSRDRLRYRDALSGSRIPSGDSGAGKKQKANRGRRSSISERKPSTNCWTRLSSLARSSKVVKRFIALGELDTGSMSCLSAKAGFWNLSVRVVDINPCRHTRLLSIAMIAAASTGF